MLGEINLLTIFITGLVSGGLTCIAVQGGLLTTALVQTRGIKRGNNLGPILVFILSKLVAYTLLGFFLGWLGSLFQVSIPVIIVLQFAVVAFMLGTALSLLNVHPIFRYFVITPPAWLVNNAYNQSEGKGLFAPTLLGFLTVFIPCGATQAMMAVSVASGSPLAGALILFIFVLGTSPVFFLLGLLTVQMRWKFNKSFTKIAAFFLILLSLFNFDAGLALANSPYTIRSITKRIYCVFSYCDSLFSTTPVSEQTIVFTPSGYSPNHFAVRRGEQLKLNLVNQNAAGCIQSFTISSLNIQKIVLPNKSDTITFTAPSEPGKITFTCSAGFYPGIIEVI